MASSYKVLGQLVPAAATLEVLYTVPASTQCVVSSIIIASRGPLATSFRIAVSPGGAAIDDSHYIYYDIALNAADTFIATVGISLATGDVIRVYHTDAYLTFSAFGMEIT